MSGNITRSSDRVYGLSYQNSLSGKEKNPISTGKKKTEIWKRLLCRIVSPACTFFSSDRFHAEKDSFVAFSKLHWN